MGLGLQDIKFHPSENNLAKCFSVLFSFTLIYTQTYKNITTHKRKVGSTTKIKLEAWLLESEYLYTQLVEVLLVVTMHQTWGTVQESIMPLGTVPSLDLVTKVPDNSIHNCYIPSCWFSTSIPKFSSKEKNRAYFNKRSYTEILRMYLLIVSKSVDNPNIHQQGN